jgi:hypothetical protein
MKATLEFNLPEEEEEFNVANKGMNWALLANDLDQSIRSMLKYHPEEYKTGEQALEHIRSELHDIMAERGLVFPA